MDDFARDGQLCASSSLSIVTLSGESVCVLQRYMYRWVMRRVLRREGKRGGRKRDRGTEEEREREGGDRRE